MMEYFGSNTYPGRDTQESTRYGDEFEETFRDPHDVDELHETRGRSERRINELYEMILAIVRQV